MTDFILLDYPALSSSSPPTETRLPDTCDDALLLTASQRWRDSSEGLRELIVGIPAARDTLARSLELKWDLGEPDIGLQFTATEQRPEHFVPLVQACAFVFQHPTLPDTLNQQCKVIGLPTTHALFTRTPQQLLERIKTLDPEQALRSAWNEYWDERAPGTPVSRRERARQFYCEHLEATAQVALARRQLTAAQLKPLALLMDASSATAQVTTQTLALVMSNGSKVKIPAAWVINFANAAPLPHWLYLPLCAEAFKGFAGRTELEAWLTAQNLVPRGLPSAGMGFEYTDRDLPLSTGMTDLLEHLRKAQIDALRNGRIAAPDFAEHAGSALDHADMTDRQRSTTGVFASPPRMTPDVSEDDEPSLFGSLHAEIPWALRQAALGRQRTALETLRGIAQESSTLQPVKDAHAALENAEQAADTAITALLTGSRATDPATFERQLTALHKAHKDGLQAEINAQYLLGQVTTEERDRVNALLDTPTSPGAGHRAASLIVSLSEHTADKHTLTTQTLNGPFVMTHPDALLDPASAHSMLLYWPGTGGGLQTFADRRSLENRVFKITAQDKTRTLQLKAIETDPLRHALNGLIGEFEEQAAAIRTRLAATAQAAEQAEQAEQLSMLRERFNAALQVPVHAARSLALMHVQEQERTATLVTNLPDWLGNLPVTERVALNTEIHAFIKAMQLSHALMTTALEPRDDFTRKHLHARLRKDFSLQGDFTVTLDLPDEVKWETRYSAGPTGPVRSSVMVAGDKRSHLTLEELAQLNLDKEQSVQQDSLSQRLIFMRLKVIAANRQDRIRLLNGVNLIYLRKVLPELDLPKAYERQIYEAFRGASGASAFTLAHHRECLIEPWRQTLRLQGRFARLQGHINDSHLQILDIAISADHAQAWNRHNQRVVILPAILTMGGKDTPRQGPSTLSGVTFIQEQVSGVTLVYLPESPDGRFLRSYDNLQAARLGLYRLCQQDSMINYVAGRTVHGNVRAHKSRINEAVYRRFDAMIGVGTRWPVTTSLAAHLLDAHMGRLIMAHRDTSRSNDELYLERFALRGPRAFNYLKMALGMLPFIGTAIAFYDAWTAANQAVAAFLRGEIGDGLEELATMLLCLIDAAVDLLPGEALTGVLSRTARALTRMRQAQRLLRNVAALHGNSQRQARHLLARLARYEYEQPISLAGLQTGNHGIYRGIYRHADGDFIVRQGRIFEVQLDTSARFWRLRGTRQATYRQPIALDETGQWDTWFGVHGTTFEGGGLGGGNVAGHLADALEPIWPQVIRQRLPRWWVDRTHRRYQYLAIQANASAPEFRLRIRNSDVAINRLAATPAEKVSRPLVAASEAAAVGDIELGKRRYQTLVELEAVSTGDVRRMVNEQQSYPASMVADRYLHRVNHYYWSNTHYRKIEALNAQLRALPEDAYAELREVHKQIREHRVEMLSELDQIETLRNEANHWYRRIGKADDRQRLADRLGQVNDAYSDFRLTERRVSHRYHAVYRSGIPKEMAWYHLNDQIRDLHGKFRRTLDTHRALALAEVTSEQRDQILQRCVDVYTEFSREMKVWTSGYPQLFYEDMVDPLLSGIDLLTDHARKNIARPRPVRTTQKAGKIPPKVFPTEDEYWLIGTENWDPKTKKYEYTMKNGEVWEETANQKYRLKASATVPPRQEQPDLAALLAEARTRLDSQANYLGRVQSYADKGMLPVNVEHMMVSESAELTRRADRIHALSPQDPMIVELRNTATELTATGRALRTRQSLTSKKPTDGMLLDLIGQNAVTIRKVAPLKDLGKKTRKDFMQEYEIRNQTLIPNELLWYAHFHYSSATPVLRAFEKAHLKLPEHRFLTHADDASLPYADIGKQSAVLVHFEGL
ncbi:hypothetical protein PS718_00783 [Pseudomonas fluorescens]|uniref:Dermonecrotic toxin N-terminal domain-containing protein n=1 Tax=Pseudomonas fluorescens TaxID=294 RepID=A0A5E7AE81_PSEFL|nr:DUF6543 domain-containing protein [Pseudomonas fluorescens]VVN76615.1 hypothetical protein PS718_00783 [Pseudomonas fluorescens]